MHRRTEAEIRRQDEPRRAAWYLPFHLTKTLSL